MTTTLLLIGLIISFSLTAVLARNIIKLQKQLNATDELASTLRLRLRVIDQTSKQHEAWATRSTEAIKDITDILATVVKKVL